VLEAGICGWCRFDARDWSTGDLTWTVQAIGPWWRQLLQPVDPAVTGPVLAHAAASHRRIAELERVLTNALAGSGVPPWDGDDTLHDLERTTVRLAALAARTRRDGWATPVVLDGTQLAARDLLVEAVHDATHHLMEAGRCLRALGIPPTAGTGAVVQVNVSAGGVPKLPVAAAFVGKGGVEGDRQAVRRHHGRPWQALCLWSVEVIERLAAEGHPVAPGTTGENLTLTGIDWRELRPGVRMRIGQALIETSLWTLPCRQTAGSFSGGDFSRMHHDRERGVSRMYAWVLEDGRVAAGDPVVVEP
jgi:MOSC domain-containing protein YiiM